MTATHHLYTQQGFTIAEVLLVVALFGIVSLAVVPIASDIVARHRLAAATRQVSFEVARARMQAVGQNAFVRIVPLGDGTYARERSTDGVSYVAVDGPVALPSGYEVSAGTTGVPSFNRQGVAPGRTTLMVRGPAGQRTLAISIIGRVTVE